MVAENRRRGKCCLFTLELPVGVLWSALERGMQSRANEKRSRGTDLLTVLHWASQQQNQCVDLLPDWEPLPSLSSTDPRGLGVPSPYVCAEGSGPFCPLGLRGWLSVAEPPCGAFPLPRSCRSQERKPGQPPHQVGGRWSPSLLAP